MPAFSKVLCGSKVAHRLTWAFVDPLGLLNWSASPAVGLRECTQDSHPCSDSSWDSSLIDGLLQRLSVVFVSKRIEVSFASVFSKVEQGSCLLPRSCN